MKNDIDKVWINIKLEEFKTLREENIDAGKNSHSILRYGLSGIGLIVAAGVHLWNESMLPEVVFLFFVPFLVYLVVIMWMGEILRKVRVGKYIYDEIEIKLNKLFDENNPPLNWEHYLRSKGLFNKNNFFSWNYLASGFMLLMLTVFSIIFGNYKIAGKVTWNNLIFINGVEVIFLLIMLFIIVKIFNQLKQFLKE